jgi:dynein heavy chain
LFEDVSYLSLKPLSTWINDLAERVNFMGRWLLETKPKSFWISAFFFPQGFNTAVLQTYARKKLEPIDTLTFRTNVLKVSPDKVQETPEEGLNIHGLFLQGASWNWQESRLKEPDAGELWHVMPVIW